MHNYGITVMHENAFFIKKIPKNNNYVMHRGNRGIKERGPRGIKERSPDYFTLAQQMAMAMSLGSKKLAVKFLHTALKRRQINISRIGSFQTTA